MHASAAAGTDAIGRIVWESAARARKLGETVSLARDDDDAVGGRPGQAVVTAGLAGLALWAIVLFLLGLE